MLALSGLFPGSHRFGLEIDSNKLLERAVGWTEQMSLPTEEADMRVRRDSLLDLVTPPAVIALLIGGLLVPGGEKTLAYPAAVVCAPLVLVTVVRLLPKVHWIVIFDILIFGSLGVGSLLVAAPQSAYGAQKWSYFITLTLLSASVACLVASQDKITAVARTWVLCAAYLAVVTVITAGLGERAAPFDTNPIWVGRIFSAGIVMLVWLWLSHKLRLRWAVLLTALLLVGLFAVGSRGPLLAAGIGVAILLILDGQSIRRLAAVGGVIVALLVAMQLPLYQESRLTGFAADNVFTDALRSLMVDSTISMIRDHPFGVGVGNWRDYSILSSAYRYPHNLFLEVTAEFGVIVGLMLSAAVALLLVAAVRRSRQNRSVLLLAAWLAVETIHVSVSGDLNARTFFFVLALAFLMVVRQAPTVSGERDSRSMQVTTEAYDPLPSQDVAG